jgi:hypothetical protein
MRVVVRRHGGVGKRRGATPATALAGELSQVLDGRLSGARFDVRYATERVNMDACDMRVVPQSPFNELHARGAAPASQWDGERLYVAGSCPGVGGWYMCHGMITRACSGQAVR